MTAVLAEEFSRRYAYGYVIRWAGIRPELAEFVNAFIEDSGSFDTLPLEKRRDIENQMDAFLPMVSLQRWQPGRAHIHSRKADRYETGRNSGRRR
jgi:hypothetical protein